MKTPRRSALAVLFCVAGCQPPPQGKIGDTLLAQADGLDKLSVNAEAQIVEFPTDRLESLPAAIEVRLAIARDTPWHDVRDVIARLEQAGKTVVLLAASRRRVGRFTLNEELQGEAIRLWVNRDGKSCVSPPGVEEAKCVKRRGRTTHVDRAFTRQLIREAVKEYKLKDVVVEIPPDIEWADVLRAVDGARTCCKAAAPRVRVREIPDG